MAISPLLQFPGNIDTSDATNYPLGKAQDVTAPSAGDGTPWVAVLLNDVFGFQQAMLAEAGITPSNTPDTAVASQYLEALLKLMEALTKYRIGTEAGASLSYDSTDHRKYDTLTNVGAVAVTMDAPVAPYGDVVTLKREGGAVTINGNTGITIATVTGGSNVISTVGKSVSLVSKSATVWELIQ